MISERLAGKHGARAKLTLINTRAPKDRPPHLLSVLTAIVKHVSERGAAGAVLFRVPERDCRRLRLAEGQRYALELVFPRADLDAAGRWLAALRDYLAEGERNFALAGEPALELRDWSQGLEGDHLPEELCLEFFTPFSFNPQGVLRTRLGADQFLAAIERRLSRVLDLKLTLPRDQVRVLPWYWDYVQFPHAAHSEPGVKYLNGCVGKLYVKGAGWDTLAAVRLCADLQLGAATAFGLGYYRLHETSVPYFAAGFPDPLALRAAVEQVMERYDDALPLLSRGYDLRVNYRRLPRMAEDPLHPGRGYATLRFMEKA